LKGVIKVKKIDYALQITDKLTTKEVIIEYLCPEDVSDKLENTFNCTFPCALEDNEKCIKCWNTEME